MPSSHWHELASHLLKLWQRVDTPASLQELVVEHDTDAGVRQRTGDEQALEKVVPTIGARLPQRDLRSGHDNRLAGLREEEAEDRGRVRERVGAGQDDEAVILVPVLVDELCDLVPVCYRS